MLLTAVVIHSAVARESSSRQLILSLALVPLTRILSLSMPLANIPQIWWYVIIYVPLFAAGATVAYVLGYRPADIGFTFNFRLLPVYLAIAMTGILFGVAEYFILSPIPLVMDFSWQSIWLPALIFLSTTGFVEEFTFRGVLQCTAVQRFGWWRGVIYVSVLFAILH
ncbi:type II CAAX prenyl endopeptidase Rce1 family protein [Candidatus Omnitrophota bacterium]